MLRPQAQVGRVLLPVSRVPRGLDRRKNPREGLVSGLSSWYKCPECLITATPGGNAPWSREGRRRSEDGHTSLGKHRERLTPRAGFKEAYVCDSHCKDGSRRPRAQALRAPERARSGGPRGARGAVPAA